MNLFGHLLATKKLLYCNQVNDFAFFGPHALRLGSVVHSPAAASSAVISALHFFNGSIVKMDRV